MKKLILLFPLFLFLAASPHLALAQEKVPFSQMRLSDERVLRTPYWWAWYPPDADVKRPLNTLTEQDARRLVQGYGGNPFVAFIAARSDMFYEPGVVMEQTFTVTLYSSLDQPQRWSETLYFSDTYAIRELITTTVVYRNPNVTIEGQDVVFTRSPYARYRYIIEDYKGDRLVGVNTNAKGDVVECALIERAILERPSTIWRSPVNMRRATLMSKHRRENWLRVYDGGYGYTPTVPVNEVIFEGERLRPLYAQNVFVGEVPIVVTRWRYDVPIPDFLSSDACRANRSVSLGYPPEVAQLFGGDVPGEVRIARRYTLDGEAYMSFAIVASSSLTQTVDAVRKGLERGANVALTGQQARIYGYPAVQFSLSKGGPSLRVLNVDVIALEPQKTLVRGQTIGR